MRNKCQQHEMHKEITLAIGKRIEPRDLGVKKYQSLIPGIILIGEGCVKEIKKELHRRFPIFTFDTELEQLHIIPSSWMELREGDS